MPGPLDGIRVVDVSAILAGPLATMMLADQGADVIKVEPPGIGDLMRARAVPPRGPLGVLRERQPRQALGRRSTCRSRAAARCCCDSCERADVFVQNFRPGAVERLGIAESDLRAVRPDLIYVSISGYGESGPYRDRRVYDPILQGLTGHVAIQKNPDVPIPDLIRHVVVDKASAYTAAQAITAALFARERGAGGQHVRVAMIDVALAFLWPDGMMAHTLLGENVAGGPTLYELYRLTETADGHLIYFAASRRRDARRLPRARPARTLRGPALRALRARARTPKRSARSSTKSSASGRRSEILERLVAEQVPAGPVQLARRGLRRPAGEAQRLASSSCEHPKAGRMRQARAGGALRQDARDARSRRAAARRAHRRGARRSSATERRRARCCAARG